MTTFNLLERVQLQCREHPSRIAIASAAQRVSYGDLNSQGDAIAAQLRRELNAPEAVMAVVISDRGALIPAMLGVFQAGAVFAPLDVHAPDDHVRRVLDRLQPTAFLSTDADQTQARRLADALPYECPVLVLPGHRSDARPHGAPAQPQLSATPPDADQPSYVYFTSGSTGQPKGIAGRLSSLARRIAWELETFAIPSGWHTSQLIAPTFDPWFRDIFIPLCSGGTIHVPPDRPARMHPEALVAWLRDCGINLVHCGPTLLNAIATTSKRVWRLPDLKLVLLSGEFLHVSLVRRWQKRFGKHTRLVNLYGATEATMMQFCHVLQPQDRERAFIPIGRPLPGEAVRLVNEDGHTCAPGEAGEIWVGGPAPSLGYFRDEAATRQAFVDTDLGGGRHAVMYRTGDLAVQLDDGTYRLLGRHDDQLKIRGVRIEPRETEDVLTGYPLVAACAVTGVARADGDAALVAYVVPETTYSPAVADMRAYVRDRLPAHLVPNKFVLVDKLPLTETGKVDRRALPQPDWSANEASDGSGEPRTPLETALAEHWSAVLGVTRVGIHDHLLDLGGHSLSAMRLVTRLKADLHVALEIADIFNYPTISRLAEFLETHAGEPRPSQPPRGQPVPTTPPPAVGSPLDDQFACPTTPSPLFGVRPCNLVLVLGEYADRDSFDRLARLVHEWDASIQTAVVADEPGWSVDLPARPTLFFSPGMLRHQPRVPGQIVCGRPLSKSEEYAVLAAHGVPIPRWVPLREGEPPDLNGFGAYVVRKPDYGAKGAEVRIVRRDRVRWKPVVTSAAGPSPTLLVQEFIYTGLWPVSYRVNTLFGRVTYAMRLTANRERPVLRGPDDFDARGSGNMVSIVANARDSVAELCHEAAIIRFGERAARAFPDVPMLGVDILKDANTGQLFVTEVNALGYNWNFTRAFRDDFKLDPEPQFDGVRKCAYLLAEQTQQLATS